MSSNEQENWVDVRDAARALVDGLQMSTGRALAELKELCATNRLRSREHTYLGGPRPIPPPVWRDAAVDLERGELRTGDHRTYIKIEINDADLQFWLKESSTAQESTKGAPAERRGAGGAPRRYNWDLFYIEIIRIAHLDGLPPREELTKRMAQWCSDNFPSSPSDSVLRERIHDIYLIIKPGV
jgi:hypothetical protein